MIFIYNLLAVPLYYSLINYYIRKKESAAQFFIVIVSIHAILFRALANPYNFVDTEAYAVAFDYIKDLSFSDAVFSLNPYSSWGVGFVALNWLVSRLSSNVVFLYAIISCLSVGLTLLFYKKTSYLALTSVMFYLSYPMLYFMGFGVIRQHLSIPFLLLALYYIDNLKVSIPFAVISILLHTGSLIFIPFYFVVRQYRKHSLFYSCAYSVVIVTLIRGGLLFILSFLPRYEETYQAKEATNNIVPVFLIGFFLFLLYISKSGKRIKYANKRDENIVLFILYGLFVSILSIGVPAAGRLSLPFIYALPVGMTYLYRYTRRGRCYFQLYFISVIIITVWQYYISYSSGGLNLYVYSFYWEPQILYK